jgi:hypothetical protein
LNISIYEATSGWLVQRTIVESSKMEHDRRVTMQLRTIIDLITAAVVRGIMGIYSTREGLGCQSVKKLMYEPRLL